jgi:hypothetical protein
MGFGAAMVIADWVALVWLYREPGCKLQCIHIACSCYTVRVVCLTVGGSHSYIIRKLLQLIALLNLNFFRIPYAWPVDCSGQTAGREELHLACQSQFRATARWQKILIHFFLVTEMFVWLPDLNSFRPLCCTHWMWDGYFKLWEAYPSMYLYAA